MQDTFLPHGGTEFDDMKPTSPLPTEEQLNSLAFRMELNKRPGVSIFVANQEDRIEMRRVLKQWLKATELHHRVDVFVDAGVAPGQVRVAYS